MSAGILAPFNRQFRLTGPMVTYRPEIDGLRAIAVLSVVLFHAGVPWMTGGYVGVDIFFVISGYLITRIIHDDIQRGTFSIIDFYERRARRILPALLVMIAASLIVAYLALAPYQFRDLSKEALSATFFYSNIRFHEVTDYFSPESEFLILLHTWSLAVEEQFYIVFPPLLLLLTRWSQRRIFPAIAVLSLVSLVLSELWLRGSPTASFYLAPARAWELGIGALLALDGSPRIERRWLRELVAVLGLAALLFPVFAYDSETPFPGAAALAPCLGAAAIIATGATDKPLAHRLLSLPPMVFVGLISYSLYLWHWPVLAILRNLKGDVALTSAEAAAAVAGAFLLAALSWAIVERPFRQRHAGGFSRRAIFGYGATGMAAVALVTGLVRLIETQPHMFDGQLRLVAAAATDKNPDRARCFARTPAKGLCHFGAHSRAEGPVDFILWGDSHADAIMPGIAEAARVAGKTGAMAGLGGCIPLLDIRRAKPDNEADRCVSFNAAVMADLESRRDARLVILAGRWPLWTEGYFPPGEKGPVFILTPSDFKGPIPKTPAGNFETVKQAMASTVARIRATGRDVVIVGGVPEPGWNVPRRLLSYLQWGQPLPKTRTKAAVVERNRRTDAIFASVANPPSVRVLNVTEQMCDAECPVWLEGRPLYFDDDHLSRYGAIRFIAPLFTSAVFSGSALQSGSQDVHSSSLPLSAHSRQ